MNGNQLKACPRCGGRAVKEFKVQGRGTNPLSSAGDEVFAFNGKIKCPDCGFNVGVNYNYKVDVSENPGFPFVNAEGFITKIWQGLPREDAE